VKIFLEFQGIALADFVGSEEAKAAEVMLKAVADEAAKSVNKQISAHAEVWKAKKEEERLKMSAVAKRYSHPSRGHVVSCPSCQSPALVTGEEVSRQPAVLEDEELVVRSNVLPTKFECRACGLEFEGHSLLHASGLGGQFTNKTSFDPVEYYAYSEDESDGGEEFNNE